MPIFTSELEDTIREAVTSIQNARVELLKKQIPTDISAVQFQIEMVRDNGEGRLKLKSFSATPRRTSISETPETVEESTQVTEPTLSVVDDASTQNSTQNSNQTNDGTQQYGRETLVTTQYKD